MFRTLKDVLLISTLIIACILSSCKEKKNSWDDVITNANQIEVSFYNESKDELMPTYGTENKDEINAFKSFVKSSDTEEFKCDYDACIIIDNSGTRYTAEINLSEESRHIVYTYNAKVYFKELSVEGYNFLTKLNINK